MQVHPVRVHGVQIVSLYTCEVFFLQGTVRVQYCLVRVFVVSRVARERRLDSSSVVALGFLRYCM